MCWNCESCEARDEQIVLLAKGLGEGEAESSSEGEAGAQWAAEGESMAYGEEVVEVDDDDWVFGTILHWQRVLVGRAKVVVVCAEKRRRVVRRVLESMMAAVW